MLRKHFLTGWQGRDLGSAFVPPCLYAHSSMDWIQCQMFRIFSSMFVFLLWATWLPITHSFVLKWGWRPLISWDGLIGEHRGSEAGWNLPCLHSFLLAPSSQATLVFQLKKTHRGPTHLSAEDWRGGIEGVVGLDSEVGCRLVSVFISSYEAPRAISEFPTGNCDGGLLSPQRIPAWGFILVN
jgi:hypothetical protein